ncbi:MAG: radical SAM protein [Planctomycetota bacterium]|jgi:radical SAM superfamily enzyme YgiQ (UPF0313 family)|nr:radical SAM protein [Planctomycetota bacterium]
MKRKIVLYYPVQSDPARGLMTSFHLHPMSLLAIAAWPVHDGYEVELIDGNLYGPEEAHRRVVEACEGALLYATTGILGYAVADGYHCTRAVKEAHPELPAFIGGWFANAVPEMQLETGLYDAVCMGQGELTFREIVHTVDRGGSLDEVAGLALWRDGKLVRTDPRGIVGWKELLDNPWDLLDWGAYAERMHQPWHKNTVETMSPIPGLGPEETFTTISYFSSFGCPLDCAFCCSPEKTNRRWKAMPAERMLDDIERIWKRWNFDALHFFDANWGVTEKRVHDFAKGLIEREIPIHYFAYVQADSVCSWSDETLDLLAESGLYAVIIGAETGSDETMEMIRKTTRGENNILAAQRLDQRSISAHCTYLIGFPGEGPESMLKTLDQCRRMAHECPIATPSVWEYQPIPGAALYGPALEQGFDPPKTLEEWGAFYDYRRDTSPGWLTPEVERMRKLYRHFTGIVGGEQRGKIGFWERRAARRLGDDAGFARGWPWGLTEARIFSLWQRLERRLPRRWVESADRIEPGWKTRRGHHPRVENVSGSRREEVVYR